MVIKLRERERERERERDEERESKREGAEKETERKKKKQKVREVDRQGNNYIQTCVCLNNPYAPDWALDSGLCTLHYIIIALVINEPSLWILCIRIIVMQCRLCKLIKL